METAPVRSDEAERVRALRTLGLLDTPAEESYDRLVRLTARLLDVPIALVSLVDDRRQWFKARVGIDAAETPRDQAFCAHAIAVEGDGPFVVEDATADHRFFDNPFVAGDPDIRFYAGQPLREPGGHRVGTLCAIDRRPRQLSEGDRQALADLAGLVEELMARREIDEVLADLHRSERTKSLVLETMHEGLVLHAADGTVREWNRAAEVVLGLTAEQLTGAAPRPAGWQALHPEGQPMAPDVHPDQVVLHTGEPVRNQLMGLDVADGQRRWLLVSATPIDDDEDRSGSGVLSTYTDITEQHRAERELRRFDVLFRHANDLITIVDGDGRVLFASPSNERILGYPGDYHHADGVFGIIHPDDRAETAEALLAFIRGERQAEPFTVRVLTHDGEERYLEAVVTNLLDEADVGGVVIASRDVSERQRLSEQLAHQATHDHLTGLPNRAALEAQLAGALARAERDGNRLGLCYVDLDGFKQVNDELGHAAGDELLADVAERLRASVRSGDTPARLGGDEFVALLEPVADGVEARSVATRICDALAGERRLVDGTVRSDASVGVALSQSGDRPADLLKRADRALYRAKHDGRGRVHLGDG